MAAGRNLTRIPPVGQLDHPMVPVVLDDLFIDLTDGESEETNGGPLVVETNDQPPPPVSNEVGAETSELIPVSLVPKITFRVRSLIDGDPGVEFELSANETFQRVYYQYAERIDRLPDDISIKNSAGIVRCTDNPAHAGVQTGVDRKSVV